ncbi:MAG: hypothetical protein KAT17_00405 [Candidatus Aminicenantes bacterium]|nr:hypothetical protein [Candidatus Aminicenantes bacterium]
MAVSKQIFMTGRPISEGSGGNIKHWILFLLSQLGFGLALTCLYLGMRGIMRLGGFVASGGPYEIAHQAPDWIWIMPVSIFLGIIVMFVSFAAGKKIGGPNLMALAWSALFISLGWNFLEFGFSPPMGEGLVWGWIICGVIFVPMGAIPLLIIFFSVRTYLRSQREKQSRYESDGESNQKKIKWGPSLLLQLIAVGLGIYLGIGFFNTQASTGPAETTPAKEKAVKKSMASKPDSQATTVEFEKAGRSLYLVARPGGSWEIHFESKVYHRIRDLPPDVQRLFKKSLKNIKGLKK